MTSEFDAFIKRNHSFPPEKLEGYESIQFHEMLPSEREEAKRILTEDLYRKFDNTAIEALFRIDKKYVIDVVSDLLKIEPVPNGASLDCAKFLYQETSLPQYAEIILQHFLVSSRFYRRSAINAAEIMPSTPQLLGNI